jgi:Domain of unknown function (DUF6894)
MLRYFFNFSDGKRTYADSLGVELPGIAAARENAREQIREMKGSLSEQTIQNWSGWNMIVTNANGKTVFEISFNFKPIE